MTAGVHKNTLEARAFRSLPERLRPPTLPGIGGLVLRDFALALFVGLTVGAYSSIFVATPVLAWLKEREPRYRALRARAQADLARRPAPSVAPVAAVEPTVTAPPVSLAEVPT